MINLQSLMSQVMMSNQPAQALMGLLNPQQKSFFNQLKGKPNLEQAETIAKMCNENGITKNQLAQLIGYINGNKN